MSDKNSITRESLTISLEERYKKQKVGGAYDAKTAGGNTMLAAGNSSFQSTKWTVNPGFRTKSNGENFNSNALNYIDTTKFSNVKYKG